MHCPFFISVDIKLIDSRLVGEGSSVRRRQCSTCNERFTTFELVGLMMSLVIKNNGIREIFNENKLYKGMMKDLEKRPVNTESTEIALIYIKSYILLPEGE